MIKRNTIILLLGMLILTLNIAPQTEALVAEYENESEIIWRVSVAPKNITNMFYSEGGNMLAENESLMSCVISDIDDDIVGYFTIGNISVTANDTEIAKDLVLGVWGTPTEWWPGLFIDNSTSGIETLNTTAFAAADRVEGNYLNGTMTSRYENVTFAAWNSTEEAYSLVTEECIIFDYVQDPIAYGEPQISHLTYSLNTGVLVNANTSYSFGTPYNLVIQLIEIRPPIPHDHPVIPQEIAITGILGGTILGLVVVLYMRYSRKK